MDPVIPSMEEPPAAEASFPSGGVHDEGDSKDTLGGEEVRAMTNVLVGSAKAGAETAGPMPGSATQDPPMIMKHVAPTASQAMEIGLGHPV